MIEIMPVGSKQEQELICARLGVTFRSDSLAYKISKDAHATGICQFRIYQKDADIFCLIAEEEELYCYLLRAVMNFCSFNGVLSAHYIGDLSRVEDCIEKLGFSEKDGIYTSSLT